MDSRINRSIGYPAGLAGNPTFRRFQPERTSGLHFVTPPKKRPISPPYIVAPRQGGVDTPCDTTLRSPRAPCNKNMVAASGARRVRECESERENGRAGKRRELPPRSDPGSCRAERMHACNDCVAGFVELFRRKLLSCRWGPEFPAPGQRAGVRCPCEGRRAHHIR